MQRTDVVITLGYYRNLGVEHCSHINHNNASRRVYRFVTDNYRFKCTNKCAEVMVLGGMPPHFEQTATIVLQKYESLQGVSD